MFLLIIGVHAYNLVAVDFNTSHVSINREIEYETAEYFIHFNTSHVSINLDEVNEDGFRILFQYISCFY